MKVVLDTNILISALGWNGNERDILLESLSGELDLLLSVDITNEFLLVLSKDKFSNIQADKIARFIELILETSVFVDTRSNAYAIKDDPQDNRILECALDGKADCMIACDKHLLNNGNYKRISILKAREFLSIKR